jgi:hypothetical protein
VGAFKVTFSQKGTAVARVIRFWCMSSLCGANSTRLEEIEIRVAIHLAFHELQTLAEDTMRLDLTRSNHGSSASKRRLRAKAWNAVNH